MDKELFELEKKILNFLSKTCNKKRSFSLLEIADMVDPYNKYEYSAFETILRVLEINGTLYQNEDDSWCLFPNDDNLVQGEVKKNQKGTVLIDTPDGKRYILNPKDAGYLLDKDIITFRPTSKTSGGRLISEVDKIIKRNNGLVVVSYTRSIHGHELTPLTSKITYPICLPEEELEGLDNYDQLLVEIGEVNYAGVIEAKTIRKIQTKKDRKFVHDNLSSNDEYSDVEFKEDVTKVNPALKKKVVETVYDSQDIKTYIANADRMKAGLKLANYTVTGVININKYGDGFVEVGEKRYRVKKEFLSDVFDGDTIEIRPSKLNSHGVISSVVESVVERNNGLVIVEVGLGKEGEVVLKSINKNLKHKIVLPEEFDKPLVEGELLLARIGTELKDGNYVMEFVKSIGHKDDPDIDLKQIAAEFEIDMDFSEEELEEANSLPTSVSEEEKQGRVDYTEEKVFSIDGARTKDRDDALSIKKLENGNYSVGIHIADVTHYIKPGMALWNTILSRATSVYMTDTVIPMLPHILSNGILSLKPGVDRLTFSCIVELTPEGEVVNFDFKDTVINSKKAMVYDDVNKILEEDTVPEGYEDFVDELQALNALSHQLSKKRAESGAVDFDDIESDVEIIYDSKNRPIKFVSRKQRSAEKLIENFMLLAGECAANYTILPTTYRVHEHPSEGALEDAMLKLHKLGVKIPGLIVPKEKKGKKKKKGTKVVSVRNVINGSVLSKIIHSIKNTDVRTLASNIILCSMKRARIDVDPEIGHYALAKPKICRFTSGIRRAEDDICHYQIRKQRDVLYDVNDFEEEYDKDIDWIGKEAIHITKKQYNAEKAERAAIQLKMIQAIEPYIGTGEEFLARVTYINEEGIFVRTRSGIVGKIDPKDYADDRLIYDDSTMSYVGKYMGERITVGQDITVTPIDTHREYRTINFGVGVQQVKKLTKKRAA